jgi:hypothetical protein
MVNLSAALIFDEYNKETYLCDLDYYSYRCYVQQYENDDDQRLITLSLTLFISPIVSF